MRVIIFFEQTNLRAMRILLTIANNFFFNFVINFCIRFLPVICETYVYTLLHLIAIVSIVATILIVDTCIWHITAFLQTV